MPKISSAGKQALNDLLSRHIGDSGLPGVVLAVSNLDEEIYSNSSGRLVHGEPDSREVALDTVFWLCSMTKLLTGIAALQLVEEGKLDLDTPASKYFPELETAIVLEDPYKSPNPKFRPAERQITVSHLLTQSSGLNSGKWDRTPSHVISKTYTHEYKSRETVYSEFFETVKGKFPGIPLVFEPGTAFTYGLSTDVLGFIVEKVSGQNLEDYLQEHIFKPLGVQASFHLTEDTEKRFLRLHFRNPDGGIVPWTNQGLVIQRFPKPVYCYFGGGGVYSTLPDYLTILRHLLQIEAGRDVPNAILKQASVKSLFEPKLVPQGVVNFTGMMTKIEPKTAQAPVSWSNGVGINLGDWDSMRKSGSAWWSGWAGTYFFMDPKTGIAFVYGSQVVPPMDPLTLEVGEEAERIIYANLEE